ncbi:hypothetical protein [Sulfitobacter sp. 20_GPM-1509m]|uniref:hypothetical protein n=1 Tax=Sulfitobacter sp. 20_GPM-1509m TaxID=1380367 RepID=UPI00048B7069|nr:hypothetical protein [Sulfitobacter sp. 20_GPM-1509m]
MQHNDIIKAIKAHSEKFRLKPSTVGQLSVQNRNIYQNLLDGKDIQVRTAERIMLWIDQDEKDRLAKSAEREGVA